ncbi:MAG TPA: type IX secretion system protein PorQ [Bacteroidota bacterium]|nr:type IX secretion system protein PorQ [Bacteroidota bacterium]
MTRFGIFLLLIVMLPSFGASQGTTAYDFLRNDVSARAAALGGSFVSTSDDPNLIFYNPAGLASLSATRFSVGFFKELLDINAGYVSFGTQVQGLGYVGGGINYVNYGDFQRTGDEGQDLGSFGAGDLSLTLGYAGELQPGLAYGVNAKLIYSSIAEVHSSAVAIDLGTQYSVIPSRLIVGASILNLGTQLDPYMTTREQLPFDIRVGATIYPEHLPAAVTIGFHKFTDAQDNIGNHLTAFSVGVEFTASPNFQLRMGYNNELHQELSLDSSAGLSGISLGVGILPGTYTIDYAFTSYGKIGAVHRISVSF